MADGVSRRLYGFDLRDYIRFVESKRSESAEQQFERFKHVAKRIIAVPKSELEKREREWRERKRIKGLTPHSKH